MGPSGWRLSSSVNQDPLTVVPVSYLPTTTVWTGSCGLQLSRHVKDTKSFVDFENCLCWGGGGGELHTNLKGQIYIPG